VDGNTIVGLTGFLIFALVIGVTVYAIIHIIKSDEGVFL
jgi:hypothetical protein|tara:strand:+ start:587 stop:703 length:117 start_codon:yes stop_codon:yes gene_type:complete